jgi:bacteriocin-like protein
MRNISINELSNITGGGWTVLKFLGLGIAAGLTFISAVVYGYFHPEKC